jgi:hypothetical protein
MGREILGCSTRREQERGGKLLLCMKRKSGKDW